MQEGTTADQYDTVRIHHPLAFAGGKNKENLCDALIFQKAQPAKKDVVQELINPWG